MKFSSLRFGLFLTLTLGGIPTAHAGKGAQLNVVEPAPVSAVIGPVAVTAVGGCWSAGLCDKISQAECQERRGQWLGAGVACPKPNYSEIDIAEPADATNPSPDACLKAAVDAAQGGEQGTGHTISIVPDFSDEAGCSVTIEYGYYQEVGGQTVVQPLAASPQVWIKCPKLTSEQCSEVAEALKKDKTFGNVVRD